MDKLIINLAEYVRNAYYSMPFFGNAEGIVVSGAYGALFKMINTARNENAGNIEILLSAETSDNASAPKVSALADQEMLLTDTIKEDIGEAVTVTEN